MSKMRLVFFELGELGAYRGSKDSIIEGTPTEVQVGVLDKMREIGWEITEVPSTTSFPAYMFIPPKEAELEEDTRSEWEYHDWCNALARVIVSKGDFSDIIEQKSAIVDILKRMPRKERP